jgi:hypothetical protein
MPGSRPWLDLPIAISREAPSRRGGAQIAEDAPLPVLRLAADATLVYPLVVLFFLYGEWLLAGSVLGHPPLPSWNDPKSIPLSSWLHTPTLVVVVGWGPAMLASLVLNPLLGLLPRFSPRRLALRILAVLVCWGAFMALLLWDPLQVLNWFLD